MLVLAPGMRGRLFDAGESTRSQAPVSGFPFPVSPARLVQLDAGTQLQGEGPPSGWSHLVIKSIPRLATGDLDTVSAQAFEIAQRIRPLIVADVRHSSSDPQSPFHLDRVGVGLCAPSRDGKGDVVVSSSSVEGSLGPWSAKQRLILAALSFETSRARMAAATSSFALVRTPVNFLVSGVHQKINFYYALLVDARTGDLQTLVWPDCTSASPPSSSPNTARRLSSAVFDLPQDVSVSRILGKIPISWSFAIRELPSGTDVSISPELIPLLIAGSEDASRSAEIEEALARCLKQQDPRSELAVVPR